MLLEVGQEAMHALGDQFDLTVFHDLVLENDQVRWETPGHLVDGCIAQKDAE